VSFGFERSEESLFMNLSTPVRSMSEGNFAPIAAAAGSRREAGSPLAPTAASTAPPSTPALAVPVAYAT